MANIEVKKYRRRNSDVKSNVTSDATNAVKVTSQSKNTSTSHKVQIPQGIPFSDLFNPYVKNKRRGSDVNAQIISTLVLKNQWKRKPINSYVPLNAQVLRNICGGDYGKYISALIQANIIEEYSAPYPYHCPKTGKTLICKGTYSLRLKKSKQYRLTCNKDAVLESYTIVDKTVIAKINKARVEKLERLIKSNPTAKLVYENLKRLSIDYDEAKKQMRETYNYSGLVKWARFFLRTHTAKELKQLITDILQNKKSKAKLKDVFKKYGRDVNSDQISDVIKVVESYVKLKHRMHYIGVLAEIEKGNHSYISISEDKRTRRIFHTLTMTPRNIRTYIKLDGKQLVELDASNCQWQIFLKLCNILCDYPFYQDLLSKYGIITAQIQHDNQSQETLPLNILHTFFDTYKDEVIKESKKLAIYLERGLLRQYIIDEYREKKHREITSAEAKGYLIKNVLFGNPDNQSYPNWTSVKAFREAFPTLYEILVKLKRYWIDESHFGYTRYDDKKKQKNRFKALPLILQKMESEIFQDGLTQLTVPFITIHDAVVTNEDGQLAVLKALTASAKRTNTKLTFKHTRL
jgi:hypothetical protein